MKTKSAFVDEFFIGNRNAKLDYVAYLYKLKDKFDQLLKSESML